MTGTEDGWRIEVQLTESGERTELRLIHHLDSTEGISDVGPGWEYCLDVLVAARDGIPQPVFEDCYPSMKAYFETLRP